MSLFVRLRLSDAEREELDALSGEEHRPTREQLEHLVRQGLVRWRRRQQTRRRRAQASDRHLMRAGRRLAVLPALETSDAR